MHGIFTLLLLICSCAGIVAEILTISSPEKIMGMIDMDPAEITNDRLNRMLFTLSFVYMLVIVLLFFSGNGRFRVYGAVMVAISLLGWMFRSSLRKHTFIMRAESTISLILLVDIVRTTAADIIRKLH